MTNLRKVGLVLLVLGLLMFLVAVDQFTHRGEINEFFKNLGMISFIIWLPTTIIGFVLILVSKNKNRKKLD